MAKGQYGLPTLYGNQYGQGNKQQIGFQHVLNPFRQPPQGGNGQGSVGHLPPPQGGGNPFVYPPPTLGNPYPPGTHQAEPPKGTGDGTQSYNGSPFGGGAQATGGGGGWYQPTPPTWITSGYSYRPRQMPEDLGVAYDMGAFRPSTDNSKLYDALPSQYKRTLAQWSSAGASAYAQAYLDAMRMGSNGIIINGKYMSGNDAAAMIKQQADDYMNKIAQAKQQNQPRPQPTPFRIGIGGQ